MKLKIEIDLEHKDRFQGMADIMIIFEDWLRLGMVRIGDTGKIGRKADIGHWEVTE